MTEQVRHDPKLIELKQLRKNMASYVNTVRFNHDGHAAIVVGVKSEAPHGERKLFIFADPDKAINFAWAQATPFPCRLIENLPAHESAGFYKYHFRMGRPRPDNITSPDVTLCVIDDRNMPMGAAIGDHPVDLTNATDMR